MLAMESLELPEVVRPKTYGLDTEYLPLDE